MIRLLVLTCVLTVTLVAAVIASRLIAAIPDPPLGVVLLVSGSCAEPCWHGIRPGEMTLREVAGTLRADGYTIREDTYAELCWDLWADLPGTGCARKLNPEPGGSLDEIELDLPDNMLRVGDLVAQFGEPQSVRLCLSPNKTGLQTVIAYLYFKQNVEVMAHDPLFPDRLRLDVNMSVTQVLFYPYDVSWYSPGAERWQEFTWQPTRRNGCS